MARRRKGKIGGGRRATVRTRFRVKGTPDSPTREEANWAPPPGIAPAVWSVRMHLLAAMVGNDDGGGGGGVVADVGCGHGLLALGLVTSGRVDAAIGVDCSAPEVEVAREKVLRAEEAMALAAAKSSKGRLLEPVEALAALDAAEALAVEVRLGEGVAPLTPADHVHTLVVAGMGRRTMTRILDDADLTGEGDDEGVGAAGRAACESVGPSIRRLVLNPPAKDAASLRRYLFDTGAWVIDNEQLCVENEQMHVIISASRRAGAHSSPSSSSWTSSSSNDAASRTPTTSRPSDEVWMPFRVAGGSGGDADVRGTSSSWRPNAGDVIQWVGVKGDVLDLEALSDEVIGPVLRRRRPPLLKVYLRDRLEWTEGKRRAAKLRLAKVSLERRLVSQEDGEALEALAAVELDVKEEVRWLGAVVSVMASLLGELELEQFLR